MSDYNVKGLREAVEKAIQEQKVLSEFEKKIRALPFKYKFTRVYEKNIAPAGKTWLIVRVDIPVKSNSKKPKFNTYTNKLAVSLKLHEDEILIYATELYKVLVKKYKLAG